MMKKIKAEIPRLFDKADKLFAPFRNKVDSVQSVSYTHLDVYKRQRRRWGMKNMKQTVSGASSPPSNVWRN